jgi:putative spermidine/putrescine transport system substrate-binding protein
MLFIRFRNDPAASAEFVKIMPYPGFNPKMMDLLSPELVATLPTAPENAAVQFEVNDKWWSENNEALTQRWNEWLLT